MKEILKRGDIGILLADSLCCTTEINTTLQSNYIPIKINLKIKVELYTQLKFSYCNLKPFPYSVFLKILKTLVESFPFISVVSIVKGVCILSGLDFP